MLNMKKKKFTKSFSSPLSGVKSSSYHHDLSSSSHRHHYHHPRLVKAIAMSKDGEMAIAGDNRGQVNLWNLMRGELIETIMEDAMNMSANDDGASGTNIQGAGQHAITSSQKIISTPGGGGATTGGAATSGGAGGSVGGASPGSVGVGQATAGVTSGSAVVVGTPGSGGGGGVGTTGATSGPQQGTSGGVLQVLPNASSSLLTAASASNLIGVNQVALFNSHLFSLIAFTDNTVSVYDNEIGDVVAVFDEHQHPVKYIHILEDSRKVFTSDGLNSCKIWVAHSGQLLETITVACGLIGLSPDAKYVVSGSGENR